MALLRLPAGADTAYCIGEYQGPGSSFSLHAYGTGRAGWIVATQHWNEQKRESGIRWLPKGEWPTLLHLIDRCGFWSLPEDGAYLIPPGFEELSSGSVGIAGRIGARYHAIHRTGTQEPKLSAVFGFARRVSGFFVRHPVTGRWVPSAEPGG